MSEIGVCHAILFFAMACTSDQANLGGAGQLRVA